MKKRIFVFVLFCLQLCVYGQQPQLITADELNNRIAQGTDTTYIINFWATWCVPCVKELPHFDALHTQFHKEKVKVLLVSVDFKSGYATSLVPFLKKKGLKAEVCLLDEPDQQALINGIDPSWSGALPATLFIKGSQRRFYEKSFSYAQLVKTYHTFNP